MTLSSSLTFATGEDGNLKMLAPGSAPERLTPVYGQALYLLAISSTTDSASSGLVIVGWVPIFWEVWGKSIGGDLDVDDEGFEQRRFKPVQSLHHGYVDYQPMRTLIGLAKKAMSLQANREHKQEQERIILNYRWMIS
jgi:hypothetical protein